MIETTEKSWRRVQAQEFGKRLQWARMHAGYASRRAAIEAMPAKWSIAQRTYYSHERGERAPEREDTLQHYCELFDVSRDFLLFGVGNESADYQNAESVELTQEINHGNKQERQNPSKFEGFRYIPIIRASNGKIKTDEGALAMSEEFIPVSSSLLAGPRAFGYEIADDDDSMVGDAGRNFAPNSFVVIDPDRDVMPGKFVLVQFAGMDPTVRQMQSSVAFKPASPQYPFTLNAVNPRFEPYLVSKSGDCKIYGRVVFTIEEL